MTSRDPDKQAFERYLAGDDEVASAYARATTEAPDDLLDARIQKAARETVKDGVPAGPWSGTTRNRVALAVVVVVTVGIVTLLPGPLEYHHIPATQLDRTADDRVQAREEERRTEPATPPTGTLAPKVEPKAVREPQAEAASLYDLASPGEVEGVIREPASDRSAVQKPPAPHRSADDDERLKRLDTPTETLESRDARSAPAAAGLGTPAPHPDAQAGFDADNAPMSPSMVLERRREMPAAARPLASIGRVDPMREAAVRALRAIRELLEAGQQDAARKRWRTFQRDYPEFPRPEIKAILNGYADFLSADPVPD